MVQRRRGAELENAIHDATLRLLGERGAAGVTMEAVASAAGTSKTVLYRRWPDSTALLRDMLLRTATTAIPHADTGSYREDMLAILRGWIGLFTGTQAPTLKAIVAAMATDDGLADAFRTEVIGWRKQEMAELLQRGVARGEVRADVPVDIVRELGQSVLWHRLLVTGDPLDDDLAVRLVDDILMPVVAPRPPR
ncbi:TetR/AcrR family transcriptional regulator [Mycobacterium sp. ACS4331]|uniref:TetR/AcrR family transcriptional regulator n=1 Tax=Mycobacterium sp. ACS4331 TaxID=1834121 RepID=UPI00080049AC|nr:TetR/AcrR family transcriptional regulator [Mycobacterium sp. ACS4331]OBF11634.1 TetR family transcriptional regulator [Mycobacterium sp. ACS4331]